MLSETRKIRKSNIDNVTFTWFNITDCACYNIVRYVHLWFFVKKLNFKKLWMEVHYRDTWSILIEFVFLINSKIEMFNLFCSLEAIVLILCAFKFANLHFIIIPLIYCYFQNYCKVYWFKKSLKTEVWKPELAAPLQLISEVNIRNTGVTHQSWKFKYYCKSNIWNLHPPQTCDSLSASVSHPDAS